MLSGNHDLLKHQIKRKRLTLTSASRFYKFLTRFFLQLRSVLDYAQQTWCQDRTVSGLATRLSRRNWDRQRPLSSAGQLGMLIWSKLNLRLKKTSSTITCWTQPPVGVAFVSLENTHAFEANQWNFCRANLKKIGLFKMEHNGTFTREIGGMCIKSGSYTVIIFDKLRGQLIYVWKPPSAFRICRLSNSRIQPRYPMETGHSFRACRTSLIDG